MNEITVFEQFESDLAVFEKHNAELRFDIETPDGEADCREHHRNLRKVWNRIEDKRKETKADYIRLGKEVDGVAKPYQARVDAMADPLKAKLKEKEDRIQKEIDDLAEANRLQAEKDDNEHEAYIDNQAYDNAKIAADLKAQQYAIDKQKADIEAEKVAAEATAAAVKAAEEKAAQDAKDAAEQAERDKQEAIAEEKRKAKEEADRKAKEIADKYAKEQAEKDAADEIERKRVADVEHRDKIEYEIGAELFKLVPDIAVCTQIIEAMKSGVVPHIEINY